MRKKVSRAGNKEGSIYSTIQKINRKNNRKDFVCDICRKCTDWSICDYRKGTKKCDKCKECTQCLKKNFCDRFYCHQRFVAQVTLDDGTRTTVANESTRTASASKKQETEAKLQTKTYIKKNGTTLIEVMKRIDQQKLDGRVIDQTTLDKKEFHYKHIERWDAFTKPIQKVTHDDVQNFLNYITFMSQSEIEKIRDEIFAAFKKCVEKQIIVSAENPCVGIFTPISIRQTKDVPPFELEEQKILIDYIKNTNLIGNSSSLYDNTTIKNLFLYDFLSGARVGELGALCINDIDFDKKETKISKTLSTSKGKIIRKNITKTGKSKIKQHTIDERIVPFSLFNENLVIEILQEQISHSAQILGNNERLVFCRTDGSYINRTNITSIFKRVCRQAGVKLDLSTGCHIHMIKHTAVTRMIEAGVDIMVISKIVGCSEKMIRQRYGHILDQYRDSQIARCADYFKNSNIF